MPTKCGKRGCEKEGLNKLRFQSLFHNVDTEHPVDLCEEHAKEAQKFEKTDVDGLKKWLNSPVP